MPENNQTTNKAPMVLLVDDEDSILSALKRLLRRENYEIITCNSGTDALKVFEKSENAIGVVVSDFRMPGMNGIEFLSRVRALYPDTIRIVLSGYADAEMVQSAINQGEIYRFISKPWDDEELKTTIRASVQQFEVTRISHSVLDEVSTLRKEMRRLEKLPQRPDDGMELYEPVTSKYRGEDYVEIAVIRTLQKILNAVPAGLIGVDCDEMVTFANLHVKRVFGMDRLSILGSAIDTVLPKELVEIARTVVNRGAERKNILLILGGQLVKVDCVPLGDSEYGLRRGVLISGFVTGEIVSS